MSSEGVAVVERGEYLKVRGVLYQYSLACCWRVWVSEM